MILVTGATGYVGGRLVPRLLAAGHRVRCLVRDPARLAGRAWLGQVEVAAGDVLDPATLPAALEGVTIAYYLVHSLAAGADYAERDLAAARTFATAARQAGVARIIYLGGLASERTGLSLHLSSRQATGNALREAGVPVTEFQAAVIVGSGSLSFELIRYLTERVPIMVCPKWVYTRTQPISIRDVLEYLAAAPGVAASTGATIQIGGADVVTYGDMMLGYARARGLRRSMVPVPLLTPRLSSLWVDFVTPIPAAIARPLIDGLRNENVVTSDAAARLFPTIRPMSYQEAVAAALAKLDRGETETAWSDALVTSQGDRRPAVLTTHEGMIRERRERLVAADPEATFRTFTGIGGHRGWFYADWTWRARGFLDRLVGGVGLRRGRRDPDHLRVGDALDFWRVEALEPGRLLRLRAEMKVPGRAWLQYDVTDAGGGQSLLVQTAYFAPKGLAGLLYWYLLYPAHALIFSGLIAAIARRTVAAREGGSHRATP